MKPSKSYFQKSGLYTTELECLASTTMACEASVVMLTGTLASEAMALDAKVVMHSSTKTLAFEAMALEATQ